MRTSQPLGVALPSEIDLNSDGMIDTEEIRLVEDLNGDGDIDDNTVLVIGFGQWQIFNSGSRIVGDGGADDDEIIFDHSVRLPGNLKGGSGDDKLQGGQAGDTIGTATFGAAKDVIIGGEGDDEIHGGGADDQIFGNAGNDTIHGDGGVDTIAGDNGDNVQPFFLGQDGEPTATEVPLDQLEDMIHGGTEGDIIIGEFGNDTIMGEGGPDSISGGEGNDNLDGGSEADLIEGNAGSDMIFGQAGDDILFGQADGIADGDDGDDTIDGGLDDDTIRDDFGSDTLIGGFGDDFIVGGIGNDIIFGDLQPNGVPPAPPSGHANGRDVIWGDRDKNSPLIAEGGTDFGNGADYIEGGGDVDTIDAGAGDDRVIGGGSPFGDDSFGGTDAGDLIYGRAGNDIIASDNATIGVVGDVTSTGDVQTFAEGGAGQDTVRGGSGLDIIFGGGDDDDLRGDDFGGTDKDIVVGDQGTLMNDQLVALHSDVANSSGDDDIVGYGGRDILIGGDADDRITGNAGNDVILGDNAVVTFASPTMRDPDDVVRIATSEPEFGGDDKISGNQGADIAFGGTGDDDINGGGVTDESDILFGDNGVAVLLDGSSEENDLFSTDPTHGGVDTIRGGAGGTNDDFASGDIIIGGSGGDDTTGTDGDELFGQAGADVIVGDNARVLRSGGASPEVERIETISPTAGGDDLLDGDVGKDVMLGGFGVDRLLGDEGDDIEVGDNGFVDLDDDSDLDTVDEIATTDFQNGHADLIFGNSGNDIAIGGTAGDTILGDNAQSAPGVFDVPAASPGADTLIGDQAQILFEGGLFKQIQTQDSVAEDGGQDLIYGNDDADIVMGGADSDTIFGDEGDIGPLGDSRSGGEDTLLGDGGLIDFVVVGDVPKPVDIHTKALDPGDADVIEGGEKADIIMGGLAGDRLFGEADPATNLAANITAGDAGADTILGDNGEVRFNLEEDEILDRPDVEAHLGGTTMVMLDTDPTTLDRITTTDPTLGGQDTIYGNGLGDTIFGGTDKDTIYGDSGDTPGADGADGDDLIFGDHGKIFPTLPSIEPINSFFVNNNFFAIDTAEADLGDDDVVFGNDADDIMLGQQGDDILLGQAGDDDIIGGHNVVGGDDELDDMDEDAIAAIVGANLADLDPSDINDVNDVIDGAAGEDLLTGDNAIVIRQTDSTSPRFQQLANGEIYTVETADARDLFGGDVEFPIDVAFTPDVTGEAQLKPGSTVGRTVILLDHTESVQDAAANAPTDPRPFGNDVMAGGPDDDEAFGELGDNIMQGDGAIEVDPAELPDPFDPTPGADPSFEIPGITLMGDPLVFAVSEQATDGDDYMEGNGGNDRMYGNLGQDDLIGGSSSLYGLDDDTAALFGIDGEVLRPDGADLIYGSAGDAARLARNAEVSNTDPVIDFDQRHARDADVILGDNGNVYRILDADGEFETFNYDQLTDDPADGYSTDAPIIPRGIELLDYTASPPRRRHRRRRPRLRRERR